MVPNRSDILERIAVALRIQFMKVGIRVKLTYMDGSKPDKAKFQAFLSMIAPGADPEYARRSWHSEGGDTNIGSYKNPFVDNLMDRGRQELDLESRKEIYYKVHEMIHDDCPAVFLSSAFEYIGSKYQFRNDEFPSVTYFLSSIRNWQIANKEKEEA
jgi:ABC-type transport system substrate-binding protein